jgi:hypothetical protein
MQKFGALPRKEMTIIISLFYKQETKLERVEVQRIAKTNLKYTQRLQEVEKDHQREEGLNF